MAGLGTYLSQLREERGPSIEELARVTRVSSRYLEALEREDFAQLPAPVFTKGYIRAYCQALGVPAEEALSRYSRIAKLPAVTATVAVPAARPGDERRRSRGTLLLSFALLVGFGAALIVVALLLQSGRPDGNARQAKPPAPSAEVAVKASSVPSPPVAPPAAAKPEPSLPVASPPSPAASVSSPTAAPAPTTTPAPAATSAPAATPTPAAQKSASVAPGAAALRPSDSKSAVPIEPRPSAADAKPASVVIEPPPLQLGSVVSPYRLVARTMESTWLRVRTDDGRASEETIPAGEVREWISNRPFIVTIGNAAGVALELNGQKLPPLGGRGAVINRLMLPPAEP
jgi:cytoskeleton protein RodZ